MNKLGAISVADLLILRAQLGPQGLDAATAALLGYERESRPQEDAPARTEMSFAHAGPVTELPADDVEFPAELPRLPFLQAAEATTLKVEQPDPLAGRPISDDELKADKDQPGLALRPLIRWSKLARHLKDRLGAPMVGAQLDTRKMIRLASTGLPLTKLPCLKRLIWAPQVAILWDHTPEMYPFTADVAWIFRHLKRERGKSGFKVIGLKDVPRLRHLAQIPTGTPILAISAMGQLEANDAVQNAWLMFAKRLKHRGDKCQALNPCPKDRWNVELAREWSVTHWDRGHRLPRRGGMTAVPLSASQESLTEALLTWLAPSSLIESSLVREVRLQLGRSADAGTEWDAWHHAECWHSVSSFGLLPGTASDERLQRRRGLARAEPELAAQIGEAIRQHHKTCSPVSAEAELRLCLSGLPDTPSLEEEVKDLLGRVIDRLRRLATNPRSDEGVESGLPRWFPEMVQRLSPEMREHESVRELIAQGLALCHTWLEIDGEIPPGVDRRAYAEEERDASKRVGFGGPPVDYIVGLNGPRLSFVPADAETKVLKPLGRILVSGTRRLQVDVTGSSPQHHSLQLDGGSHPGIPLSVPPANLRLQSLHGTLDFKVIERPAWAERFWYDGFGIAAEFLIRDVPFVLRWIPPGQFLMGSPKSEVGRFLDEGPQHTVTISHGFWLGETPVTQMQWEAVVATALDRTQIPPKPKPSHFQGSADLPVEQVTWDDCSSFCSLLNGVVDEWDTDDFRFQLPTEAQWEYACRAGTQSSFHDGSTCTVPEGFDLALDRLGWFNENGVWTTQAVKGKQPNSWGLFDMHGNVWEWCADAWDTEIYPSCSGGVVDPVNDKESADRVMRGGSWRDRAQDCRAACRVHRQSDGGWSSLGLRLSAGQERVFGAERRVPQRWSRG